MISPTEAPNIQNTALHGTMSGLTINSETWFRATRLLVFLEMRSSFAQRGKTSGARGTRLSWSQLQIPLSRSGELRRSCRERYSRTSDALHSCWPSSHICLRHFSKSSTHSVVFSTCLFRSRRPSSPQGRISSVTFSSESRVRDTV